MSNPTETVVETYDGSTATLTDELLALYSAAYAGPPYHDGPADLAEFVAEWPDLLARPGFRLVVARLAADGPVGFALGHTVEPDSEWWPTDRRPGAVDMDVDVSFGIAELGVHPGRHRHGIAGRLHEALLAGRPEPRVVLWVRVDAPAARATYRRWGYRLVGSAPGRPLYQVMCLDRRSRTGPAASAGQLPLTG